MKLRFPRNKFIYSIIRLIATTKLTLRKRTEDNKKEKDPFDCDY